MKLTEGRQVGITGFRLIHSIIIYNYCNTKKPDKGQRTNMQTHTSQTDFLSSDSNPLNLVAYIHTGSIHFSKLQVTL